MIRLKYALTEEKGERDMSDSKRRLWTIPNVLTLIRLILVPVYWVLMLGYHLDYWALGAAHAVHYGFRQADGSAGG